MVINFAMNTIVELHYNKFAFHFSAAPNVILPDSFVPKETQAKWLEICEEHVKKCLSGTDKRAPGGS